MNAEIPFHKLPEYLRLLALENEESDSVRHDSCELALVTVKFGRLKQELYLRYQAQRSLDVLLEDYRRRAIQEDFFPR